MTTKNRFGAAVAAGLFALAGIITAPTLAYAKSAPLAEGMAPIAISPVSTNHRAPREWTCKNKLANWIYKAGFRGKNIREAWAIAMRESNGTNLGPGDSGFNGSDFGLFQLNSGAWSGESWWDTQLLLDPIYNAKIAYKMSRGGKSWIPWGMRDNMEFDTASYAGIWSSDQFYAWVIEPYQRYYAQYPCK